MVQKTASGDFLAWWGTSGEQPLLEAAPCLGFEDLNGENASGICVAQNNYLAHAEATARAALKDKQAKGSLSPAEQQQLTNLEVLDIARDLALKEACQTQGDACNAARRDLNAAIGSYATTAAGYNAGLSAAGNQSVTAELNQTVALSNDPALAQQTLWDSFKEFAGPQAAGYVGGAVIGKFIGEAQAVYAAIKAQGAAVPGAVGTATGTKLPVAADATATSPYSSSGTSYGKTTLTDANGNPIATQPTVPGVAGGVTAGGTANTVNGARLNMQLAAEQAAGTRAPTTITSYSDHAVTQIGSRDGGIGVSQSAVNDAFANPVSIQYVPSKYGPTFKYTGQNATVVVNSEGNVVTTWATNSAGTGK